MPHPNAARPDYRCFETPNVGLPGRKGAVVCWLGDGKRPVVLPDVILVGFLAPGKVVDCGADRYLALLGSEKIEEKLGKRQASQLKTNCIWGLGRARRDVGEKR